MTNTLFHKARRGAWVVLLGIGYMLAWLAYIILGAIFGFGLEAETDSST